MDGERFYRDLNKELSELGELAASKRESLERVGKHHRLTKFFSSRKSWCVSKETRKDPTTPRRKIISNSNAGIYDAKRL